MLQWIFVAFHLLAEAGAARRDVRIRFLKAQVEILRRKLGGNRVIPSPDDRARLLALGQELDHNVADVIGIVTPQTYSRWVIELREGRKAKPVGRPKVPRNLRELVVRLAKENACWRYRPHQGLGNRTIPAAAAGLTPELVSDAAREIGRIRCRRFLGGLLRH